MKGVQWRIGASIPGASLPFLLKLLPQPAGVYDCGRPLDCPIKTLPVFMPPSLLHSFFELSNSNPLGQTANPFFPYLAIQKIPLGGECGSEFPMDHLPVIPTPPAGLPILRNSIHSLQLLVPGAHGFVPNAHSLYVYHLSSRRSRDGQSQ